MKMDSDEMTMEEKCENMMNVVVETRKRFGELCKDYDKKCHLIHNNLLKLQIKTISNYHFKTKNVTPVTDTDEINKSIDGFTSEIHEIQRQRDTFKKQLKNMQSVVLQLKKDSIGKTIKEPLTCEALLSRAKSKNRK